MKAAVPLCEVWRGPLLESVHFGHAVICDDTGQIVKSWGDPDAVVYPRSSSKMIQALPMITSGAAASFGLGSRHLALSCASHNGAYIHTNLANDWLSHLGLGDDDYRCGPQMPRDPQARSDLFAQNSSPCQVHNNCSGKHCGFLTLNKHLGADAEYIDANHPVQRAALDAFETVTNMTSPGFGIDGCSAPNPATTMHAMARAMAWFASAHDRSDTLSQAAVSLRNAMMAHPELVAGEGRACTELMRALDGKVALKTGAEGYFIAIIPDRKLGIALKVADGATRASECAITALLVSLGVLDKNNPTAQKFMNPPILNRRDIHCGDVRPAAELMV